MAAIVGLGIIFLMVFLFSLSSGNNAGNTTEQQNSGEQQEETVSNEPPYIRIPENSKIYQSTTYGFSFAYPDSFGELTVSNEDDGTQSGTFRAESALAAQKPVGNGTAFMNGRLSMLVYSKDDFKVVVSSDDVSVAPTKTGNDITWKVVSSGSSNQGPAVGSSYSVKSTKSQTGIPIFDFIYRPAESLALGRWVFAASDHYIMVALPSISKPSGENLTESDMAAYQIIGTNIAKSVRLPDNTN